MSTFVPTPHHPLLVLPTPEQAATMGQERWASAMMQREKAIREERGTPLWKCWEPPIWKVCDALIGAPWLPETEAAAIRINLGFTSPVTTLYMLGGQRSSKTEYAANRISRIMAHYADGLSWMFHNTMPASIDTHQKLIWKYLPPNLKGKPILSQTTYVAYKDKTGFSDGSLVLENLHKLRFLSYEVAIESLQGFNCRVIGADEFVTPDHVETFKARVSVLNGTVLVMLAPITGYTALVQSASDGAELIRTCTAFLNPTDGGPRDIARHLGLTAAEVEELRAWLGRKMAPPFPATTPNCRPQQCADWLTGGTGQPAVPEGRKFKQIARVQRPRDKEGRSAIVHFYGSDNPYGNPLSLYLLNNQVNEEQGNRIFYGVAKKGIAKKFPKFDEKVHGMDDAAIAKVQGTNYMLEDPADGRNPFRLWIRVSGSSVYVYREWPGLEPVPDLDYAVPGAWALPDGKHPDGRMGPAQDPFGLGLLDLKREVARAGGWKDAEKWKMEDDREEVRKWSPDNGARETVTRRFIDSRAASNPHVEDDRPVTMLESYAEIGLHFELTPGDDIAEGVIHVNNLFSYDHNRPVDALNRPRLFIAKSCINLIFALNTWTGRDGKKGATKDPIDLLRYFALLGLIDMPAGAYDTEGGGSY